MRNLFTGFLALAVGLGLSLIWIGALRPEGFSRELLIGAGVAVGPAALVTLVFRIFLIEDVKRDFVSPLTDKVRETIEATTAPILERYREEMTNLDELREGGVVRCYPNREEALADFLDRCAHIDGPMVVVGSTLRGVLPDAHCPFVREIARRKDDVSFVLMHPVVADLRAHQERRRQTEIGQEIIDRLRLLGKLGVRADHVYLRRGTPTCFGIMVPGLMLLNPYPYLSSAEHAPCLLVTGSRDKSSYMFEAFRVNHFDTEVTTSTERLSDLGETADRLEADLVEYKRVPALVDALSGSFQSPEAGLSPAGRPEDPHRTASAGRLG